MITTIVLNNGSSYTVGKKGVTEILHNGALYTIRYGDVGDQIIIEDDVTSVF